MSSESSKEGKVLVSVMVLIGLYYCLNFGYHYYQHGQIQAVFTTAIQHAQDNFIAKRTTDTLDFARLAPGEWDTVYVFGGYVGREEAAKTADRIDWDNGFRIVDMVPEGAFRYVFVRNQVAQYYVDLQGACSAPHFQHYYPDGADEQAVPYRAKTDKFSEYSANHFARADAKFIIVCGIDLPQGDSLTYVYVPLPLLQQVSQAEPSNLQFLHPLSGCGYSNYLANRHVQAIATDAR